MVVEEFTTGLTVNPYRMIQAIEKLGPNASIVNNPDATDGLLASVTGPNLIIMDTGYLPMNELIGAHHIDIRWYSNIGSGYGMTLQYWKMDRDGNETLCRSRDVDWHDDISDEFGNSGGGGWFNQNYQYRFILISHSTVGLFENVQVDFIKITTEDPWMVGVNTLHGDPSSGAPNNPVLIPLPASVTGDGSNFSLSWIVTCGFNPSLAMITGVSPNPNLILAITAADSTTFTFSLTHRDGVTKWTSAVTVQFMILTMDYFASL